MIDITTIPGGIILRDKNRLFANEQFSKGYLIASEVQFYIEFNDGIVFFDYTSVSINGMLYNSIEEFITAIGLQV
jgi:hypothetical protein